MKKAIPAIAIALALVSFWAIFREERSASDEGAAAQHGASGQAASSPGSPSGPFASGSGSHGSTNDGPPGARSADEPPREDRTPVLEIPATAKDGFVEVRATAQDKPIASAEVRLYARLRVVPGVGEQPWRVAGIAKTASSGLARIAARPGAYLVSVRAEGFAPARKEFIRASGDPVTRVDVQLGTGASLAGRTVAKGSREPVPLAQVVVVDMLRNSGRGEAARRAPFRAGRRQATPIDEIAPVEERSSATSDADGKFRVDGLEPGRYRVEARATGTARAALAVAVPASGEVVLELPAASFIEGSVVDFEGKPAAGAEVIASGGPTVVYGEATETGTFSLEVEPRTHFLSARLRDEAGKADDPVSVAAGQTARGVKIRLSPGASLAGVVVARSTSAPIPDARINLSPAGAGGSLGGTTTDAAGNFLIGGLAPGHYDVDIAADGFTPGERRGLVLLEGQRFPLQVTLKANGMLQGIVRDLAGKTVAAAVVRASPQFGDPVGEARTDTTGAYQLANVPAGRVVVSAVRDGAALGARQVADVPEGGVARLDLTLAEEGLLTGRALRKTGVPVLDGSATVQISPASGGRFGMAADSGAVQVDPDGSYRASVPAGSYRITAAQAGAPASMRGPGNAVFATVEAGQTVARDVTVDDAADPQTGLSGTVLEPGGAPSAGALVMVLNPSGSRVIAVAQADETGGFHVDRARADLPDVFDVSAVNGGRMGRTSVTSKQTQAAIQLQPAASLRGRVASAAKVDGFSMTISLKQGGRTAFFGGGGGPMQRQLQFAGDQFVADDLPATDVLVHVATNDGRTGEGAASLVSGQASQVDIALQDAGNVLGRVVDENGAAVSGAFVTLDHSPSVGGDERISGTDGRFRLINVAPGDHSYLIFSAGFRSATGNLSLQPGQALDLGTVQMTRSSTPPGNVGIGVGGSDAAVQVSFVFPDGPAAKAGMQVGDQLVQIDGKPVGTLADARARLPGSPGSVVSVTVVRNGGSPQVVAIQRQL
ncbi:MAG: carboxypeptidase regulatory-like domain-containing protein [Myxococcales bacterium]